MIKLYHYVHCPFCLRVRMALGYLKIKFISEVLPYNDEAKPVALTGTKMLPILEDTSRNIALNESLDIIKHLDKDNYFKSITKLDDDFEQILSELSGPIHNLCMPYWMYSKEFNKESRNYFKKKKEIKRGPFNLVAQKQEEYFQKLEPILSKIEHKLGPYYNSNEISIYDICLASHLWGLYIYPEFQFSPKLHSYLQTVKKSCHFDYHEDFWKNNNDEI